MEGTCSIEGDQQLVSHAFELTTNNFFDELRERSFNLSSTTLSLENNLVEVEAESFSILNEKRNQEDDFFNLQFLEGINDTEAILTKNVSYTALNELDCALQSKGLILPSNVTSETSPEIQSETRVSMDAPIAPHTPPQEELPSTTQQLVEPNQIFYLKELISLLDDQLKTGLRDSLYQLSDCVRSGTCMSNSNNSVAMKTLEKAIENNVVKMLYSLSTQNQLVPRPQSILPFIPQGMKTLPKNLRLSPIQPNLTLDALLLSRQLPQEILPSIPVSGSPEFSSRASICVSPVPSPIKLSTTLSKKRSNPSNSDFSPKTTKRSKSKTTTTTTTTTTTNSLKNGSILSTSSVLPLNLSSSSSLEESEVFNFSPLSVSYGANESGLNSFDMNLKVNPSATLLQ